MFHCENYVCKNTNVKISICKTTKYFLLNYSFKENMFKNILFEITTTFFEKSLALRFKYTYYFKCFIYLYKTIKN